jgi:hypothetical protein
MTRWHSLLRERRPLRKKEEINVDRPGRLRLDLFDAYGDALNERVDIYLYNQSVTDVVAARGVMVTKPVLIINLLGAPQGLYRIFIDPPSYLPVQLFVNVSGSKITDRAIPFAVDPDKVIRVNFPTYDEALHVQSLVDAAMYATLEDIPKAGLLNIAAKSRRTPLAGGGVVLDHMRDLTEVRGDRVFARVSRDLESRVRNSVIGGLFREVSGGAHEYKDFLLGGSYKTNDSYGNLQITFFSKAEEIVADIDIDDAAGLEHVFQVVRNAVTRRPTHPYYIHDILLRYQEIDPGYRFVLRETKATHVVGV